MGNVFWIIEMSSMVQSQMSLQSGGRQKDETTEEGTVLLWGRWDYRRGKGDVMVKAKRCEDAMLLALKMQERAMS